MLRQPSVVMCGVPTGTGLARAGWDLMLTNSCSGLGHRWVEFERTLIQGQVRLNRMN